MENNNNNNNNQNNNPYGQPNYQYQQVQAYYVAPVKKNDGMGIASMVLGIVSLVCCGGGIIIPTVGLVLGLVSRHIMPEGNGMATAGVVMSIIGLALSVVYLILNIVGVLAPIYALNL